jgi:hypothetical protein
MPTVRQGPKPSRSMFVIQGPLNLMPWWRLHSPPPQPPQKIFFIVLSRRPATVPRWKQRISYQAASSTLDTSTCRSVLTAWQLHMTSLWSRLLWNHPYLRPRDLSASRRIRQNAGKPSTTRTIALVRGYVLFKCRRRRWADSLPRRERYLASLRTA